MIFLPLLFLKRKVSGDEEDRTPDPLLARQVLSHLSYTPISVLLHGFYFLVKDTAQAHYFSNRFILLHNVSIFKIEQCLNISLTCLV